MYNQSYTYIHRSILNFCSIHNSLLHTIPGFLKKLHLAVAEVGAFIQFCYVWKARSARADVIDPFHEFLRAFTRVGGVFSLLKQESMLEAYFDILLHVNYKPSTGRYIPDNL